ncbi:MAG: DnaJ domain-containing protein [Dehalococcoidales bacterium]|nr:DnaJ domain-containing protein [Dehalococcoidales bacterium]
MQEDIVRHLREQERILGEMQSSVHRWMDELLRNAYNPESFFRLATSMGIDFSQFFNIKRQSEKIDPYMVMGLEKTATDEEVKKRYRKMLVILHPDTAGVKGTEYMFRELISAYQKIARERSWQ